MNYVEQAYDLGERVAVITSVSGIVSVTGMQYAGVIAESGGTPILLHHDDNAQDPSTDSVELESGVNCERITINLTDVDSISSAVEEISEQLGRIDILINNFNVKPDSTSSCEEGFFNHPEDYPIDLWNYYIRMNLTSTFLCCQQFGKMMAIANKGVILNLACADALEGINRNKFRSHIPPIPFPVAKASIINLTRYIATYWAPNNVRANCLVEGDIDYEHDCSVLPGATPLNRLAEPDDFTGAVLFMISEASSYMTGATVVVDGGRTSW